jgi:membrane fusion protein, multidrug efflux system
MRLLIGRWWASAGVMVACLGMSAAAPAENAAPDENGARALIEAHNHAVLASEIAGRINLIAVEAGQSFSQGDVLIRFDCERYQAELDSARAGLRAAEVTVNQNRKLEALQSIGAADVELAGAKADAARAAIHKADAEVKSCEIKAPFDGRVVEQKVKQHESVAAGTPLLEILSDHDLRVELMVPSSWVVWLTPGKRFDLRIDETGERLTGEVTYIGAKVDPVSQSLKVSGKIVLEKTASAPHLIAGMSGTAHFAAPVEAARGR